MTLLLAAIIYFVLSINSGELLDCAYVHSPRIGLPRNSWWEWPTLFVLNACNVQDIIESDEPAAFTFTCVAGDVYVTLWNNTNECDASVTPISYQQIQSATEFNCDSSNECNTLVWDIYDRAKEPGSECVSAEILTGRWATVLDVCVAYSSGGNIVSNRDTCDHELGIATYAIYDSSNCTAPIIYNETVSGTGTCRGDSFYISNCQILIATTAEPIATTTTTTTTTTSTIDSESESESGSESESESDSDSAEVALAILNKGNVDDFAHSRDDTVNIELNFLGFMNMNIWMVFASIFVLNVVCWSVYICYTKKGNKDVVYV